MNIFLESVKRAMKRNGLDLVYKSITTSSYNVETSKPGITGIDYTLRMYPKQFIANQYNYPSLIGKETIMFEFANDNLAFVPKLQDEITYKTKIYKIQSIQEHVARGVIVLYRVIAVRG